MIEINLIPVYRLAARAKRRRLAAWFIGGSVWGTALGVIYAICYLAWATPIRPLDDELTKAQSAIADMERTTASTKSQADELAQRIESGQAVVHQPDWSILLALFSDTLGDDVVLAKCELKRIGGELPAPAAANAPVVKISAPPKKPAAPELPSWQLLTSGMGRSPAAVSQFVLRLEATGLFDRVALVKTMREPFRNAEATAFTLECQLKGKGRLIR